MRKHVEELFLQTYDRPDKGEIALCYPNSYYVGSSNLGFHTMYDVFRRNGFKVYRFFYQKRELWSPETTQSLKQFDYICFSVSYEADFFNILDMLIQCDIELLSEKRKSREQRVPAIMIGGAAVSINPFLYATIADYVYMGDGEFLDGVEEPEEHFYPSDVVLANEQESVFASRKWIFRYLKRFDNPEKIMHSVYITPETAFPDYFLIEIARGCLYSCRFCNYATIGYPYRLKDCESVLELMRWASRYTKNFGLISASLPSFDYLKKIIDLRSEPGLDDMELHFSSMRVDSIDDGIFSLIGGMKLKTLTLAPETGDNADRMALGKSFTNRDILRLLLYALKTGITRFKFYFILGMFEGEEEKITDLMLFLRKELHSVSKTYNPHFSLSFNPLIPKYTLSAP